MELEKVKLMKKYIEYINDSLVSILDTIQEGTRIRDVIRDIVSHAGKAQANIFLILIGLNRELEEKDHVANE